MSKTVISFDDGYSLISVSPVQDLLETNLGILELSWTNFMIQGFSTQLLLHPRKLVNDYLLVNLSSWNATSGETIHIPIIPKK